MNVNNYANLLYFNNTPFTGVFGLYMANKTLTSMLSLLWTNVISPLLGGGACQLRTPDNSLLAYSVATTLKPQLTGLD